MCIHFDAADSELKKELQLQHFVFIDNSNIWIEGKKAYARLHGKGNREDPTWRINVDQLIRVVLPAEYEGKRDNYKAVLFCSEAGSMNMLKRTLERANVEVKAYPRSSWTNGEKLVDIAMASDTLNCYHHWKEIHRGCQKCTATFHIVSGDSDFFPVIVSLTDSRVSVHVHGWADSMARRPCANANVSYFSLDAQIHRIGYTNSEYLHASSRIPSGKTIVFRNAGKDSVFLDQINDYLKESKHTFFRKAEKDDLLVIFSLSVSIDEVTEIIQDAKRKFPGHEDAIVSYAQAKKSQEALSVSATEITNAFSLLSAEIEDSPDEHDNSEVGTASSDSDSSTSDGNGQGSSCDNGWNTVKVVRREARENNKKFLPKVRCRHREFCQHSDRCTFLHDDDEKRMFKLNGRGLRPMKLRDCMNKSMCKFSSEPAKCSFRHQDEGYFCTNCAMFGHLQEECTDLVTPRKLFQTQAAFEKYVQENSTRVHYKNSSKSPKSF